MKYFFWYLIVQFGNITIHAQDVVFAPIGATWSYSSSSFGPPWLTDPLYMQFIVERDTLIQDYPGRVIGCYVNENNQMVRVDSLTKYVATIGEQVHYFVEDDFVLLYDFGAQPGDTIHSKVEKFALNIGCDSDFSNGDIEFSYVVDSIGLQSIDGEDLKVLFVRSLSHSPDPDWFFLEPILERIGPISYGGLWWGKGEYCIPESGFLRCYVDQEITWRSPYFNDNLPCDYISASTEIDSEAFMIHPNPASSHVYLPRDAKEISLYDLTGQTLPVKNVENEIDISAYPSGMYFIRFEMDGSIKVSSLIKR